MARRRGKRRSHGGLGGNTPGQRSRFETLTQGGAPITVHYADGTSEVMSPRAVRRNPKRSPPMRWQQLLGKRLRELGYPSYQAYLQSEHWRSVRRRYFASQMPKLCAVKNCGSPLVELHHRSYGRLGHERLQDLVPLCREHHQMAHRFAKDGGDTPTSLWQATRGKNLKNPK